MRKIILLNLLLTLSTFLFGQTQEIYQRIRIDMTNHAMSELAQLGVEFEHGEYSAGNYFINEFSLSEVRQIQAAGFSTVVLVDDVARHFQEENRRLDDNFARGACNVGQYPYKTPQNYREGSMGGHYTWEEVQAALDSMRARFPNLVSAKQNVSDTLRSHEGRNIFWVRISDNPDVREAAEPEMLYTALHHAREGVSMTQLIFYMWYLLENYNSDPKIKFLVDNTDLYFMPCVNPDGLVYNQTTSPAGGGMWRKNRRVNAGGSFGVDLNRNYSYRWAFDNTGSSPTPSSDTYRGAEGFSEPETRAVRYLVRQHRFPIILNYHTYGNLLVYPWDFPDPRPDLVTIETFAKVLSREHGAVLGTDIQTVGYSTNGSSDDWMYGDTTLGKIRSIAMTPETGMNHYGFWAPRAAINYLNRTQMQQNLTAAYLLHNYSLATPDTSLFVRQTTANLSYDVQRFGYGNAPVTVNIVPISANIVSVSNPNNTVNLAQFQSVNRSFTLTLNNSIAQGDEILYALSVAHGGFTHVDTIRKIFGNRIENLSNTGGSIAGWTASGWGVTTRAFRSAPSSITDSPNGNYTANANTTISTPSISLPQEATNVALRFWARWDVEYLNDAVFPQISTDGGLTFTSICGKYTRTNATGAAIYDGWQSSWVEETFDLTPFKGRNIIFRLNLKSNASTNLDGFFFDDFQLAMTTASGVSVRFLSDNEFALQQNAPNPTASTTTISIERSNTMRGKSVELVITNILGQIVYQQNVIGDNATIDTHDWENGTYFYQLQSDGKTTAAKKMVVSH
jgi:hypothetical protein